MTISTFVTLSWIVVILLICIYAFIFVIYLDGKMDDFARHLCYWVLSIVTAIINICIVTPTQSDVEKGKAEVIEKIEKCDGKIINQYNVIRWKEDVLWNK